MKSTHAMRRVSCIAAGGSAQLSADRGAASWEGGFILARVLPRQGKASLRDGGPRLRGPSSGAPSWKAVQWKLPLYPGTLGMRNFCGVPSSAVGCARVNSIWFASRWRDPPKIVLASYRAAPSVNAGPPSCHRQPNAISL